MSVMAGARAQILPMNETPRRVSPAHRAASPELVSESAAKEDGLRLSVHVSLERLENEWRALEAGNHVSFHQSFDWCATWAKTHSSQLLRSYGAGGSGEGIAWLVLIVYWLLFMGLSVVTLRRLRKA